jgi:hypothetical protein
MDDSDIIVSLHLVIPLISMIPPVICMLPCSILKRISLFCCCCKLQHKMFMKLIPGEKEDFGHSGNSFRTSDNKFLGKDYPLKDYPLKDYPLKDYPLKDHP